MCLGGQFWNAVAVVVAWEVVVVVVTLVVALEMIIMVSRVLAYEKRIVLDYEISVNIIFCNSQI